MAMVEPSIGPVSSGGAVSLELLSISPLTVQDTEASVDRNGSVSMAGSVIDLLKQREQLQNRVHQLKIQIELLQSGASSEIDSLSDEEVLQLSKKLKQDLIQKVAVHDSRELVLRGLQLSQVTDKVLHQCDMQSGDTTDLEKKRKLQELLNEVKLVSAEIGGEQKKLASRRDELEDMKKQNMDLMRTSRQQYKQLAEKRKQTEANITLAPSDKKGKRLQEELKLKTQRNTILRYIIQGLILGSGVDWARDRCIQGLLLDCGNTLK